MKEEVITPRLVVVGVKFRMNRERRAQLAEHLKRTDVPLRFTREQENKHDINAIRVNIVGTVPVEGVEADHFLGYMRSDTAAVLAPKLDDGSAEIVAGLLTDLDAGNDNTHGYMTVTIKKFIEED